MTSFELNPKLGREINLEAFEPLVRISKEKKLENFSMHPHPQFME